MQSKNRTLFELFVFLPPDMYAFYIPSLVFLHYNPSNPKCRTTNFPNFVICENILGTIAKMKMLVVDEHLASMFSFY